MVRNSGAQSFKGERMRPKDMYRLIGFTPRRSNCSEKMRYSSREDAASAADEYNQQVVFGDMSGYPCARHQAWHIGHRYKHRVAHEMLLACVMWFKAWEAEIKRRRTTRR